MLRWHHVNLNPDYLVRLAEVARKDVEFVAVLGNGAAGDGDALFLEDGDDFLIGKRFGRVFAFDELRNLFFDAGVAHRAATGGLEAGCEEILHLEQALWRLHVFVGDGAADGRLVDADDVGHLRHRQRFQVGDAFVEELDLTFDNDLGDVVNGLLALVDALDEELAGANLF